MLTRDQILGNGHVELAKVRVDVPEWGDSVYVRVMTGEERDRFELRLAEGKRANYRAALVAFTACDETGSRLFTDGDIAALGALPATGLTRVVEASLRINGFTGEEATELESVAGGPAG